MSWLEFFSVVLPAISWPLAIIFVAIILRPLLEREIPRLHKLGPTGLELFPREPAQRNAEVEIPSNLSSAKLEELTDPVARELEETIISDLSKISTDERESRLVRALAFCQLNRNFALAYSNIFGSQIRMLEKLNSQNLSNAEVQRLFEEIQNDNPAMNDWALSDYLRYLFYWKFISVSNDIYEITTTGRNFLIFITNSQLSKDRLN